MKLKIYIAISILFLMPFVINMFGKSIYLYINIGEKDVIFASSVGVFHCAYADKMDFSGDSLISGESYDYGSTDLIKSKRINLFLEPSDKMEVFTFRYIKNNGYNGLELPLLLFICIPIFLTAYTYKKNREQESEPDLEPPPSDSNQVT